MFVILLISSISKYYISVSLQKQKQVDILISKNQALQILCLKHHAVVAKGGLEGLEPPNVLQRGAEPLQKYMCVMSSTSREQYRYS